MLLARPQEHENGRLALLSDMLPEVNPALIAERGMRVGAALPNLGSIAV